MRKSLLFFMVLLLGSTVIRSQTTLQLQDLEWSNESRAGFLELQIPSAGSLMQGFMYKANDKQPHPLLLVLHGYPGNERNLDLAQAARARGWNVIYFNYRGSWGSQGLFSFRNCVEDVKNVVAYCKANAEKLEIDTQRIALFGHSMGGFVCLQALAQMPGIKKGFALSAWDIYKNASSAAKRNELGAMEKEADDYFVLNKRSGKELFADVLGDPGYFLLANLAPALSGKQLIMLDEHPGNKELADLFTKTNHNFFDYQVWKTDHSFTNKRSSLINDVLRFLER